MLHKLHRISAIVIGLFVLTHLSNHLLALSGVNTHIETMTLLRNIYRFLPLEIILLLCVLFQVVSGGYFIAVRWGKRVGFIERIQAISGAYIAFFLAIHVTAVLVGRTLLDLDTNFFFAAAGMHIFPHSLFFIPYYFLAVMAFFTHIACAVHWLIRPMASLRMRNVFAALMIVVGGVVATTIILSFGGVLIDVDIPAKYLATYR